MSPIEHISVILLCIHYLQTRNPGNMMGTSKAKQTQKTFTSISHLLSIQRVCI